MAAPIPTPVVIDTRAAADLRPTILLVTQARPSQTKPEHPYHVQSAADRRPTRTYKALLKLAKEASMAPLEKSFVLTDAFGAEWTEDWARQQHDDEDAQAKKHIDRVLAGKKVDVVVFLSAKVSKLFLPNGGNVYTTSNGVPIAAIALGHPNVTWRARTEATKRTLVGGFEVLGQVLEMKAAQGVDAYKSVLANAGDASAAVWELFRKVEYSKPFEWYLTHYTTAEMAEQGGEFSVEELEAMFRQGVNGVPNRLPALSHKELYAACYGLPVGVFAEGHLLMSFEQTFLSTSVKATNVYRSTGCKDYLVSTQIKKAKGLPEGYPNAPSEHKTLHPVYVELAIKNRKAGVSGPIDLKEFHAACDKVEQAKAAAAAAGAGAPAK